MKKARFIWRSTCTTCRNARAFLRDELKVELDEREYARKPLSREELKEIFAGHDPRDFLNPKSPTYKAMGLGGKDLSSAQVLDLMFEEPTLIKRPLTRVGSRIIAGFDRDALRQALGAP